MVTFKVRKINNSKYQYSVEPLDLSTLGVEWHDIIGWVYDTFDKDNIFREFYCVRFKNEQDLALFMLKWSK